jgi:uncharacterized protein
MAKHPEDKGIRIRIRGLEDGKHPIEIKTSADVLELPIFTRDLELTGSFVKDGEQVKIDATAKAEAELECSRCTERFTAEITAPLHVELIPPELSKGEEEDDDDVHVYDPFISPSFDITQDVRDALGIALPMKPLCRKDCQGLCPNCGTNWNNGDCDCAAPEVESAWTSSLKDLQAKLRREEGGGSR